MLSREYPLPGFAELIPEPYPGTAHPSSRSSAALPPLVPASVSRTGAPVGSGGPGRIPVPDTEGPVDSEAGHPPVRQPDRLVAGDPVEEQRLLPTPCRRPGAKSRRRVAGPSLGRGD
ncbi:hypothetical protein GCM10010347_60430 [Streptomyces cirratus]|uniref:Uncharacterized protein n=1 Tax=Streptomyces cirratus TaxID=68187 RepID=A0ABQ3F4F2_9ACTN|nr:hypothetical protein GCM10010347_60430 [Streptomyces cirratus]